ncbi:alpha-glucosidase [Fulvitalea axinellae]|uniref:Alpha-glucosidase n=1 Tax=Fulvitalea axinellae TaxID=1182444 RepID=A0AAU9D6V1_9BACT|nr:alpha-glucosidase [Fulvitalea axinellae]
MLRKTFLSICLLALVCVSSLSVGWAKDYKLSSPDGKINITVSDNGGFRYAVDFNGRQVLKPSAFAMEMDGYSPFGTSPRVSRVKRRSVNETLKPTVARKFASLKDQYNEMTLVCGRRYSVTFRAYDEGLAYRFETRLGKNVKVNEETVEYNFPEDYKLFLPKETSFYSHQERIYVQQKLSQVGDTLSSLPAMVDLGQGAKMLISEADLYDYPGLWLKGTADGSAKFDGVFPKLPSEYKDGSDRDRYVTKREDFMAETSGRRTFPWRMMILSEEDKDLMASDLVFKLSRPLAVEDAEWVKPGKVAWDWYNANNIKGVDFRAGINTETYKYYIDFAADYGLEYIILDEGWYVLGDLLTQTRHMDVPAIIDYGKKKGVGVILWMSWKTLDEQFDQAMEQASKWGAAGLKVDFMQRDDQPMVNYYEKVAKEAAKRHLLVDFHGSYKPSGLRRAYPNVVSYEGVRGLEQHKWGGYCNPDHDVQLPFIRNVVGPMDYTPGAMDNAQPGNYRGRFSRPMSRGTRCHQMAMYAVFESPLQMLADSPSNYIREAECTEFIAQFPTVWEETVPLAGKVGEYVAVARKSEGKWYMGAMTGLDDRELEIDFSFLPAGEHKIEIFQDGVNADRHAEDYKRVVKTVNNRTKMKIKMAPGGGWAAIVK